MVDCTELVEMMQIQLCSSANIEEQYLLKLIQLIFDLEKVSLFRICMLFCWVEELHELFHISAFSFSV